MKAVVKEERNATKVTDEGEAGQHNRRGHCRGSHRYNNATGGNSSGNTPTAKYPTRNKDLPENLVFDNTGHNDAANFQHTLRGRLGYPQDASCHYPHRGRTQGAEELFRTGPSSNILGDP